ncbi:uncharacterized protein G2W53_015531 [Senna tora]|uniref:Uncharacterized protein n=1 Tax=Senna tora TaxID=362788 RepID=A0A834WV65_9FABA|nr:uncharacterized protein G2W53_015531 [Senna tora]
MSAKASVKKAFGVGIFEYSWTRHEVRPCRRDVGIERKQGVTYWRPFGQANRDLRPLGMRAPVYATIYRPLLRSRESSSDPVVAPAEWPVGRLVYPPGNHLVVRQAKA